MYTYTTPMYMSSLRSRSNFSFLKNQLSKNVWSWWEGCLTEAQRFGRLNVYEHKTRSMLVAGMISCQVVLPEFVLPESSYPVCFCGVVPSRFHFVCATEERGGAVDSPTTSPKAMLLLSDLSSARKKQSLYSPRLMRVVVRAGRTNIAEEPCSKRGVPHLRRT